MATEETTESGPRKPPEQVALEENWVEILETSGLDDEALAELTRKALALDNSAEMLSDLGPQTDEELDQWFRDRVGVDLPKVAVCPGHSAPFDVACDIHFFRTLRVLIIASRGGAKTSLACWLDLVASESFPGFQCFTTGPGLSQGERKYEHLLPYVVEGGVIGGKELSHIARSTLTMTIWKNSSRVLIAPGTIQACNGPRTPRLHRDEVELMNQSVYKQAGNIPAGTTTSDGRYIPAQIIDTSTMKWAHGVVAKMREEYDKSIQDGQRPRMDCRIWCIYEIAKEVPSCRSAPREEREDRLKELDRDPCELCDCDTWQNDMWQEDDAGNQQVRSLEDVCAGRLFRSRGFKPLEDIQTLFLENDRETWEAEQECSQPSKEGVYIRGYSQVRSGIKNYVPDPDHGKIYMGVDFGGCYDGDTEVLTSRGWVPFPEVRMEDEFASLDLETERVEYQLPSALIAKPFEKDMHHYRNRSVDLLVTEDHYMVVGPLNNRDAQMKRVPSRDVKISSRVNRSSRGRVDAVRETFVLPGVTKGDGQVLPDLEIAAEDWAAFLGLWMAEGHTHLGFGKDGKTRRRHGRVGITHFDQENMDEMITILEKYFKVCRGRQTDIHDPRLFDHLVVFGKAGDKFLPDYVKRWTPDLLKIYLDWHIRGDGGVGKEGGKHPSIRIYTGSKSLADDLQEISMYAGWAATISVRAPRDAIIEGHNATAKLYQYAVCIAKNQTRPRIHHKSHEDPVKTMISAEEWDRKMVYCVELPKHHTLYVRRNGKPVWCGNTDAHAIFWMQLTDREVEVESFVGDQTRVIPADSMVIFAEIYRAGIGNVDVGNMVIATEDQWRRQWPGWRVHERYPDYQNAAGRLDWEKHLKLKLTSRIKKNPPEEIKYIRNWVGKGRFFVAIDRAPMMDKSIRAWREESGHEARGIESNWSTHMCAALRYLCHNIEVIRRKQSVADRSGEDYSNLMKQSDDDERFPSRRARDRDLKREIVGAAGAEDSPNRAPGGTLGGLGLR